MKCTFSHLRIDVKEINEVAIGKVNATFKKMLLI